MQDNEPLSMNPDHPYYKIRDEYEVTDVFEWLSDVIPKIQVSGSYKGYNSDSKVETDTPFDQFDSHCHRQGEAIASEQSKAQVDDEDEIIFLINLSEHCNRAKDMLMFLGEYFKQSVALTMLIEGNLQSNEANNRRRKQDSFFVTNDILNYLGTACKMYIDNLR